MATNTFTALDKVTVGTATPSITFSSISSAYTDLVVVVDATNSAGAGSNGWGTRLRFNGDTASNYSWIIVNGNGSTASSARGTSVTSALAGWSNGGTTSSTQIVHVMNYANSSIYKTTIGRSANAAERTAGIVNLWRNTSAVTSITIFDEGGNNWQTGSTFSLYGIAAQVQPGTAKATGGTITYDNFGRVIHTFTSSGTFTPTTALTGVEYLVIAGGGGAANSGAGGAGGYRSSASGERSGGGASAEATLSLASGTGYTVTVGAGGNGGTGTSPTNGSDSVFGAITSVGGGAGRYISGSSTGNSGGSGGGGSTTSSNGTGGAGTANQGYAGGGATYTSGYAFGGGGGGAGSIGITAAVGTAPNGGSGVSSSINGTATSRAGGGGGGSSPNAAAGTGSSGGGNGELGSNANNTAGTANTGGGGGGGYNAAGKAGGSGIVIVRYQG